MLLERARSGVGGRVMVLTRNPVFSRVLEAIIAEWHFKVDTDAASCEVALVERGLTAPQNVRQILWLSPMPLRAAAHIEVPLSLNELYQYLEKLFYPQPRRHIRLPLDQQIDLNVRGVWLVGRLLSVSDRGARLTCPAHLPRGETLQLDFKLDGYPLRLSAEVIYEIPPSDSYGREHPQAGLIFRPLRPAMRQALCQFIEKSVVKRACGRIGIAESDPSLSWLNLVDDPWAELGD